MDSRKLACIIAAGFVGVGLVSAATTATAKPRDVVVVGQRIDPELQRRVSYSDLNLALRPDLRVLGRWVSKTASDLCSDSTERSIGPALEVPSTARTTRLPPRMTWRSGRWPVSQSVLPLRSRWSLALAEGNASRGRR
jgi:hypothetical protein